jgi:hypothetical protein
MSATKPTDEWLKQLQQLSNYGVLRMYGRMKVNMLIAAVCRPQPLAPAILEFAKAVNKEISLRRLDQKRGTNEHTRDNNR